MPRGKKSLVKKSQMARASRRSDLSAAPSRTDPTFLAANMGNVVRSRAGLSDIQRLTIRWLPGSAWCGDNVHGVQGLVYLAHTHGDSKFATVQDQCPVAPSDVDTGFGQLHTQKILSNYARIRYHKLFLDYEPFAGGSSTGSATTIAWAPLSGGAYNYNDDTGLGTPAYTPSQVVTMRGGEEFPSYCRRTLDLTPYIRFPGGGNESSCSDGNSVMTGAYVSGDFTATSAANAQIVPASFIITGGCGNSAFYGSNVGQFFLTAIVDLEDFVGGLPINTLGRSKKGEEKLPLAPPPLVRQVGFVACDFENKTGVTQPCPDSIACDKERRVSGAPLAVPPKVDPVAVKQTAVARTFDGKLLRHVCETCAAVNCQDKSHWCTIVS